MANSYSQIYIQIVFAVKGRDCLINPVWEDRLYQYITGIIQNKGQKLIAINGTNNHIHIFIGMKPDCCLSDLIREIKKASNEWINANKFINVKFYWQEGFGAFSYSRSHIGNVARYIENQKEHHKKITFKDEYLEFLKTFEIAYNEKYLFDWYEGNPSE